MYAGRNWDILGYCIAALTASLAMAVSGVSSAAPIPSSTRAVASTTGYTAYVSTLPFVSGCKWCAWSDGGGARARPTSVARTFPALFELATLTPAPSSSKPSDSPTEVSKILAADIAFVGDKNVTPVRFVGAAISRLATGMNWRSNAFSIAGSRVWSKIIRFSSTGINVRLPLN
jgi:hypothetical protein